MRAPGPPATRLPAADPLSASIPGAAPSEATAGTAEPPRSRPAPRLLLITGPGGAGRTTVAAATARATAAEGERSLLLSAEPARRLESVLGLPTSEATAPTTETAPSGDDADARRPLATAGVRTPVAVGRNLSVARMDAGAEFRESLLSAQRHASGALGLLGAAPLEEDELLELPGAEELALLRALHAVCQEPALPEEEDADLGARPEGPLPAEDRQERTDANGPRRTGGSGTSDQRLGARAGAGRPAGPWDTVVVDMPPLPRAAHALVLPEVLGRYLRRLVPPERQAARALRPLLAQLAQVPVPGERLYEVARRAEGELAAVQRAVRSPGTAVRLVVEPGPLAVEALRTAHVGCDLYGLPVEAVVANRLLPDGSSDPWLEAASRRQRLALQELCDHSVRRGAPVYGSPHLGRDPRGGSDLDELEVPSNVPPALSPGAESAASAPASWHASADAEAGQEAVGPGRARVEDRLSDEGRMVWRLALPGVRRSELDVVRRGDELIVTAGPYRRVLELSSALRRCRIAGAALEEGELVINFAPDPELWPRSD